MVQSLTLHNCDCCNKKSVCKFEDKIQKYKKDIDAVEKSVFTPFRVDVRCNEFEKKPMTPRDTFYIGNNFD